MMAYCLYGLLNLQVTLVFTPPLPVFDVCIID